jgi:hypothetical protein
VFPGRSLSPDEQVNLQRRAIERAGRAVVLVPDFRSAKKVTDQIAQGLGYPTFTAAEIEGSKTPFIQRERAVAIMANRYDGIDFPDEQCRLLIMDGLPGATNLQERFLLSRMGARLLLHDRIRTRVVQAIGRCTRSTTDYSAVLAFGEDLLTYLSKRENRDFLDPELQAEITFGLDQSRTAEDMVENLNLFYARGEEWRAADNEIRRLRAQTTQRKLTSHENLAAAVPHEIDFQYSLWNGDGAGALEAARKVLTELKDPALQGYRALWNYLAGCAASKMARDGATAQQAVAREYFALAARAMPAIPWLRELAGAEREPEAVASQPGNSAAILVERLEKMLDHFGTMHDQRFAAFEKGILQGLASSDPPTFEKAHEQLGTLLGFEAGNEESKGAPDPWWLVDKSLCLVFEDHSDAQPTSKLSVAKARQVALHPNWIRKRLELPEGARVLSVLVTPVSAAEDEAAIHLKEVAVWPIEQFRVWAVNAVQMVRQLRVGYPGAGDMFWRGTAMQGYEQAGADPASLLRRLQPQSGRARFEPIE